MTQTDKREPLFHFGKLYFMKIYFTLFILLCFCNSFSQSRKSILDSLEGSQTTNFASTIQEIEELNKKQKALKPSIASLADYIDTSSDYGKLISSIKSKKYDEIDTQVFNDFYSFLDDLKTKTTDTGVKNYLNVIQEELISLAPLIEAELIKK
jgi:hypothetical protein